MSCSPFDLRDYVWNELAETESRQVETHVRACAACREELDRLRITHAALASLPEEEIPRRIGFVSDPVFAPGPLRRWWQAFWASGARLGFASAAVLAIAIAVSALTRPAPAPPAPAAQPVDVARLEAQFERRLRDAVGRAVAEAEARQQARTDRLLAASEARHAFELKAIQLASEQEFSLLQKRLGRMRLVLASAEPGVAR